MKRFRSVCLAGLIVLAFGSVSQAQFSPDNVLADPFTAYFGYFIPRQQSIAAQRAGGAVESINQNAAARRAAATAARDAGGLFQLENPYQLDRVTERNFVRPPTILVPGQPAGPQQGTYFGRTHSSYGLSPVGRPGTYRAAGPQTGAGLRGGGRGFRGGGGGGIGRGGGGFR